MITTHRGTGCSWSLGLLLAAGAAALPMCGLAASQAPLRLAVAGFEAINVTLVNPTSAQIVWMPRAGAASYQILRNNQIIATLNALPVNMSYVDAPLAAGTNYTYVVQALNPVTTITGLPGTPNAGRTLTSQSVLDTSVAVTVTTTLNVPVRVIGAVIGSPSTPLRGFVELHAHPLSNLAFGGKLLYGGVDSDPNGKGSLLPTDPNCNHNVRALSEAQALGHDVSTHGAADFNNPCGDLIRPQVIHAMQSQLKANDPSNDAYGYPSFAQWPRWDDITHQKMWVEWIRRAYLGGLRVMVALAVNNKTIGDMVAGPGDLPTDDKWAADAQIDETIRFVGFHNDFMEVAFTSADVQRIVSANKLAVIIGVEIDHIGNLGVSPAPLITAPPPPDAAVVAEIDRLYNRGVRYIFPIHLLDNAFGGTAAYEDTFNVSNMRESGHPWALICAPQQDGINYSFQANDFGQGQTWLQIAATLGKLSAAYFPPSGPNCPSGQRNSLGLLPSGVVAIKEMMHKGMLIDVDHMSQNAFAGVLQLAQTFGYPINSGHNGVRGVIGSKMSERSFTVDQYRAIGALHGMAGVGTAALTASQWLDMYQRVTSAMGPNVVAGFGTDTDGLERGMPPPVVKLAENDGMIKDPGEVDSWIPDPNQQQALGACVNSCSICDVPTTNGKPGGGSACESCKLSCSTKYPPKNIWGCVSKCPQIGIRYPNGALLPFSSDGSRFWDYNVDGVAHYGMLPDFVREVASLPGGAAAVNNFMFGADYLFHTWQIAESRSGGVH